MELNILSFVKRGFFQTSVINLTRRERGRWTTHRFLLRLHHTADMHEIILMSLENERLYPFKSLEEAKLGLKVFSSTEQ